jgi:hypothetical protein
MNTEEKKGTGEVEEKLSRKKGRKKKRRLTESLYQISDQSVYE